MGLPYSCRIPRALQYFGYLPLISFFAYKTFTSFGWSFQTDSANWYFVFAGPSPHKYCYLWFRLFPFRSPLLWESIIFFLFLGVIGCFGSPGSLPHTIYSCADTMLLHSEFPHSDICGSMFICNSPQLFAACHVLLRRLVPRHSPYALFRLIVYRLMSFSLI